MKNIFGFILAASLFIGVLGGCVRYENGKPVEEPKTEKKEEKSKVTKKEEPKKEEPKITINQQATTDLKQYFDDNFNMASWYELIKGIEVNSKDIVTIKTDVLGDADGKKAVENIDNTVWGYTNTNDSKYNFKEVNILDKDGHIIISGNNPLN